MKGGVFIEVWYRGLRSELSVNTKLRQGLWCHFITHTGREQPLNQHRSMTHTDARTRFVD